MPTSSFWPASDRYRWARWSGALTSVAESRLPLVSIVEDDEDLADLYAEWLKDSYRIRTAHSADEAKATIDDEVDVVLLDRMLPGISGDELLDWIQAQGFRSRIAVITGVSPDFDVIEMGFDTYLQKPTSRGEVRDTVRMLLTRTMYDQRVQRYLVLQSKKRVLEEEMNDTDLEANQNYQRLSVELREIRSELGYLLRNLDEEYFAAEMQALVGESIEDTR